MKQLSQKARRILVTSFFLSALLYILSVDENLAPGIHIVIFTVALILFLLLLWTTQVLAFRASKYLDERQVLMSLQANKTGLLVGATVALTIFVFEITTLAPLGFKASINLSVEDVALIGTIFLCLPTMLVAWLEPDPIREDVTVLYSDA